MEHPLSNNLNPVEQKGNVRAFYSAEKRLCSICLAIENEEPTYNLMMHGRWYLFETIDNIMYIHGICHEHKKDSTSFGIQGYWISFVEFDSKNKITSNSTFC